MCDQHEHVEVRERILATNDREAAELRDELATAGTLMLNLISSPGSGKTSLLQSLIRRLPPGRRVACLVGDVETELDAERLRETGAPARQILTGGACHLDARQIRHQLSHLDTGLPEILFVENVGNLVCPSTYDLGEDFKVGLLSVTEGDDKPFKYPALFSRATVTAITKIDLMPHVDFDLERARDQLLRLRPDARVIPTSIRTGEGLDELRDLLEEAWAGKRQGVTVSAG